ncbi:MAG: hypothetical protein IPG72_03450 [Ardenticatenales bacterium]|nr:hypothetical protein [Ardenticatenales bacterium]
MTKSLLRVPLLALLTAVLVAGLGVWTARTASAQNPCGPTTVGIPYNTAGQTFNRNVCAISATVSYEAHQFVLIGPGPHTLHVDTCGDGGDTVLQVYQAPGGAPNAFNPLSPGTNQVACNDDFCGLQSSLDVAGLAEGSYTIVVSNWSSTAAISGVMDIRTPQCVSPSFDELPVAFADPLNLPCTAGRANLAINVTNTGLGDLPNLAGPEFTVTLTSVRGGAVVITSISSGTGGAGQAPGAAPLGGTATADLDLPAGASDTITLQLAFPNGIGSVGGIFVSRAVWADLDGNGAVDAGELFEFVDEIPLFFPCAPTVWPNDQLGKQVHLPILNFQGQDDVCESWIEVQNLGCRNAKAALVTWGEPGFCPPQAAGPLKVECTGLLKPGSTWNLYGAQVPTGSKSGILFKLSARQLSEDGIDVIPEDDITGDYVCEVLFFNVVGDADDYRRFKKAYNEGLVFDGIDMVRASGDGLLAVDVHRSCPGDATPGVDVTSKYNGLAGTHLGTYDEVYGGYSYYVPLVYASAAGFNTIIYIQNGGLMCSSLEIWFKARDDCLRATICDIATLAPGETYQLDANDCVGPDFQGSAWIRSTQVMGIAVDIIGGDVLMTYVGEPGEINYTFDPNQSTTKDGNQVAFGPLIYSEYQGWDTGVQVQNLSAVFAAKVKIYFLDRSGDIITTLVDWVCPRGSQTFFLPVVFDLPGNWVGSMRAESQEWITPGGPNVLAPNIVGVATLIKYNDVARTQKTEAIAYNLLPEHKIYDWQLGNGGGGLDSGIGLIAIPSVLRDLENSGLTTEIAIANVVPKPGFTDLVIYFYDQNGLLDYICQKLNEKQVEYIDLQTWGYINDGFQGLGDHQRLVLGARRLRRPWLLPAQPRRPRCRVDRAQGYPRW